MKLEMTLTKDDVADELDSKLAEATETVQAKSKGLASLTHKRLSPKVFLVEMSMAHGNFLFDRILISELKKVLKKIDPDASIRKVK